MCQVFFTRPWGNKIEIKKCTECYNFRQIKKFGAVLLSVTVRLFSAKFFWVKRHCTFLLATSDPKTTRFKNIFLWPGEGYLKLKCCYLFCDVVNCKESKESLNLFPFIFSAILWRYYCHHKVHSSGPLACITGVFPSASSGQYWCLCWTIISLFTWRFGG